MVFVVTGNIGVMIIGETGDGEDPIGFFSPQETVTSKIMKVIIMIIVLWIFFIFSKGAIIDPCILNRRFLLIKLLQADVLIT